MTIALGTFLLGTSLLLMGPASTWLMAQGAGSESTEFALFNLVIGQEEASRSQGATEPAELRTAGLKEYSLGHFLEAQRLLEKALPLALQKSDTYLVGLIHDGLGVIYQDQTEFTNAEQEFKKALDILRRQPEHSQALAMTLANFGAALCGEGRYREASPFLSEASRIVKDKAINDPQLQVHILDVSANVSLRQGQFKKAESLFLAALRMSTLPENATSSEVADVSNNLATLYAAKGNYPKAVASYARALDLAEKRLGPTHPNITTILGNLGFTYVRMRRYDEAESQFLRSLAVLESNGLTASPMILNTLYGLGRISMEKNQLDRAQSLLARAVETGRTTQARTPAMAETLELYGKLLRTLSRYSEAENLHIEASRIRAELALTTRAGY